MTTVWTDDAGNQVIKAHALLCDLNDVLDDIKPGRYSRNLFLAMSQLIIT